jgi:alpha-L-fucosidase
LTATAAALAQTARRFEPNWESLKQHEVPKWYEDAKLGIFIHWGIYSVPAWAPPTGELGKVDRAKWFYVNPYAEWYLNSLRLKDTPTYEHHVKTYGANFDYYQFAKQFSESVEKWNPKEWATLFRKTGARYVVLTSKHHDGFTLWPSRVPNPKRPGGLSVTRDLVGDLTKAVRDAGLKMGLYYSGGLDWTFDQTPITSSQVMRSTIPQNEEYANYADAHWRELIARYQPTILWNDIGYPKAGNVTEIFADYYNNNPDGLVNNRFSSPFADFTTPEYTNYDKITPKKWESCRGLGYSFGYNQVEGPEHVLAPDKLVNLLVDIVSKNGNLLLNIGPKADGGISQIQMDRLNALGKWLDVNGEGIFGSRPCARASAQTTSGEDVRFTQKDNALYAFLMTKPKESTITIPGLRTVGNTQVQILGSKAKLDHKQQTNDLVVSSQRGWSGEYAIGLKITPAASLLASQ